MYKFTIYAHYEVMINSDAYNEMKEENEEFINELKDFRNDL